MDYNGTNKSDVLDQTQLGLPDWSTIYGLEGDDTITVATGVAVGGVGNDRIIGVGPYSAASFQSSPSGVHIDLSTGTVQDGFGSVDTLVNINDVRGSGRGDTFKGNSSKNQFWSFSSLDVVDGGGGIDKLLFVMNDKGAVPTFDKTETGWTISYKSNGGYNNTVQTTSVEVLSIYRGGSTFENWDLTVPTPQVLPEKPTVFQPRADFSTLDQWRPGKWGIVSFTISEDVGAWYYPTPTDYHAPHNLSIDAHNGALGDFNGDGYQDLVISWVVFPHVIPHTTRPLPTILFGSANGLVKAPDDIVADTVSRHQAYRTFSANLNGDDVDDIVTGAMISEVYGDAQKTTIIYVSEPTLAILGRSSGSFKDISDHLEGQTLTAGQPNSTFDHATGVGDLNKDGIDDIISGNNLWISDGHGNWTDQTYKVSDFIHGTSAMSYAIGDLNHDGANDVLALFPNFYDDREILFNDAASSLKFTRYVLPAGLYGTNTKDNNVVIADVNYDGLNDIVVAETRALPYYIGSAMQILIQRPDGAFVDETSSRINNAPRDQVQGGEGDVFYIDMNGDGFKDILHSNDGDGLAIFLNDGNGHFTLYDNANINFIATYQLEGYIDKALSVSQLPQMRAYPIDDNHDGIMDLVVQAVSQYYGDPNADVTVALYIIDSTGKEYGRDNGETLSGTPFDDFIYGVGGNDSITGGSGNDTLDGGAGIDTAVYSGIRSNYLVTKTAKGYTVRANAGTDGTDTLTNFERVQFTDTRLALDMDGNTNAGFNLAGLANAGQVYRLYQATFNRTPDKVGLAYWIGQADSNVPLTTIASGFTGSVEFNNTYGNLSNHLFVDQMYQNVLHRPGEAGGVAYWYSQIDGGTQTRQQILVGFAESNENQAAVIGVIQNGIDYTS